MIFILSNLNIDEVLTLAEAEADDLLEELSVLLLRLQLRTSSLDLVDSRDVTQPVAPAFIKEHR